MTGNEYPKKKEYQIACQLQTCKCQYCIYVDGYNACHDAFMKVIESQPALVPLDEKILFDSLLEWHLSKTGHVKASDMFRKQFFQKYGRIVKFICSTFGQVTQRDEVTVEDIANILDLFYSEYLATKTGRESIAKAIHDRIYGGKNAS